MHLFTFQSFIYNPAFNNRNDDSVNDSVDVTQEAIFLTEDTTQDDILPEEMTRDESAGSMVVNVGSQNVSASSDHSARLAQQQRVASSASDPQPGPSGLYPPPSQLRSSSSGSADTTHDTVDLNNNNSNSTGNKSFLDMTFGAIAKRWKSSMNNDSTPTPADEPPQMVMADPSARTIQPDEQKTPKNPRMPTCPKSVILRSDIKKGKVFSPRASSTPSRPNN